MSGILNAQNAIFLLKTNIINGKRVRIDLGYNRYFDAARDCAPDHHSRATECRCGGPAICRAKANLLHTHAIAFHQRALEWLVPLLSKADEARSTRLMPVDLEIRQRIEQDDAIHVFVAQPSPLAAQNRSSDSDVYTRRRMYRSQGS